MILTDIYMEWRWQPENIQRPDKTPTTSHCWWRVRSWLRLVLKSPQNRFWTPRIAAIESIYIQYTHTQNTDFLQSPFPKILQISWFCICIYYISIYPSIHISPPIWLDLYIIYIYIYMCVCTATCVYLSMHLSNLSIYPFIYTSTQALSYSLSYLFDGWETLFVAPTGSPLNREYLGNMNTPSSLVPS